MIRTNNNYYVPNYDAVFDNVNKYVTMVPRKRYNLSKKIKIELSIVIVRAFSYKNL